DASGNEVKNIVGLRSPVRIIEDRLEAVAEDGRKARGPGCIEQTNRNQIADMRSIFVSESSQLDLNEGSQRQDSEVLVRLRIVDIWIRNRFVLAHLLAREHDLHRVARLGIRAVEEYVHAADMAIDKA